VRILVVEDELSVATGIRRGLGAEGFLVDTTADGADGLDRALSGRYDLVILDLMVPTMNGYQICRSLREADRATPILMLTAKTGEWDEVEAFETGADDFLSKPFSMAVLVARTRRLVRRRHAGPGGRLTNGDLVLEAANRRCWRGDDEIALTGREVDVLSVLLEQLDEVVTKADLLQRVWGLDFEGDPNIVEVYIGRLRRKIDAPFGADDIETIRGVGYRFRPRATRPR
jgi:two-component system, OmpR family, response regulator